MQNLATTLTLCLGEGPQHCDEDLAVCFKGVYILCLEDDSDAQFPKRADIVQAVHRISGKSGDGFGQHNVDFLLFTQPDHLQKFRAFPGRGASDALIGKDSSHGPVSVGHDFVGIVGLLGLIAGELFFVIGRDPAVSGYPELPPDSLFFCGLWLCWNRNDLGRVVSHVVSLLPMI